MKTIQEIEKLLQEGNLEEGYKELQEYQNVKKDEISLYYLTVLDLDRNYFSIPNDVFISRFEKLIKSKKTKIRQRSYEPYLSLLLDLEDYERCYEVSNKARSEGLNSYLINLAFAKSSIEYKEIKTKEIEDLLISNIENSPSEEAKTLSQTYICEYYCKNKKFEEAKNFIYKLYFTHTDGYAQFLNLMVATYENPKSDNLEQYEKVVNTAYHYDALLFLSDYYYYEGNYERALIAVEELLKITNNEINVQKKKAICLLELNKIEEARNYLLTIDQKEYDVCYLLGKIEYNEKTRLGYHASKEYFFKALDINPNEHIYKLLLEVCKETRDFENWKKVIDHLEKTNVSKLLLQNAKINYYIAINDFDEALKLCDELGKFKYFPSFLSQYSDCILNPNKLNKYFKKIIKYKDYDFFYARANLYGYYGLPINKDNFLPYIKRYEKECMSNCVNSLIAKYYLDKKDFDNALKYINRGMKDYNIHIDKCTCIVGYYVYCLMNGLGMEKDIQGAYDLAVKTIEDNFECVSESLGNLYAECAIMLKKDLNDVFDFLVRTRERRYSLSRYFMIIKVGRLLNKDISYYENMYQKSFKYENKLECNYYKNNPETFMMNNF